MFNKIHSKSYESSAKFFESSYMLNAARSLRQAARNTIQAAGYCLDLDQQEALAHNEARVAALHALTEQGVGYISSSDRYRLDEVSRAVESSEVLEPPLAI
ncbi:MAG TPA: hypothetical protein VFN56_02260 [Candidatus Saccharimonadales bacterium]|nr:hypothetical protein [Candidatus Saccharimonadales bacterium]